MSAERAYESLTDREREVLVLMARGLTNGQIAERLGIGFETAKTHVSRVIAKTGAGTREEAVANYRALNRPLARLRRQLFGLAALPAAKIGLGIGVVVAVAVAGLVAWQAFGSSSSDADQGPVVQFWSGRGNDYSPVEELSYGEALQRQQELVGVKAPIRDVLLNQALHPLVVNARLPPENLPFGIAEFAISFGDGPTEALSNVRITFDWTCNYSTDHKCDSEDRAFSSSAIDGSDWDEVIDLDGGNKVGYFSGSNGDETYVAGRPGALLITQMNVWNIPREQAIAILESVLANE